MIGLIVVVSFTLYLILTLGVIRFAGSWASRRGRRKWPWCTAAGFFMYLLIAWDQIPTFLVTEYYCATQAGLTVYKTPEQWKLENPGVAETLTWSNDSPSKAVGRWGEDISINERMVWSIRQDGLEYLPVGIYNQEIRDIKNGAILARDVSVGAGYDKWLDYNGFQKLKFWIGGQGCNSGHGDFLSIKGKFKRLGREANQ